MEVMTETEPALSVAQQIMDLDRQYVMQTYARYPLVLQRGRGC